MNRTTFLIDGFNLYHSLVDASRDLKNASTKWLNIKSLCDSYLAAIGNNAQIEKIYYFSALAEHMKNKDPEKVNRHINYIKCLEATGLIVELGRFKPKTVWCDQCKSELTRYEEKETDVAISIKTMEVLMNNECDTVVLVTGDTDLAPAVRTVKRLFPDKDITFIFPYKRKNKELVNIVSRSFKTKKEHYTQHQFPNPVILRDGSKLYKPTSW